MATILTFFLQVRGGAGWTAISRVAAAWTGRRGEPLAAGRLQPGVTGQQSCSPMQAGIVTSGGIQAPHSHPLHRSGQPKNCSSDRSSWQLSPRCLPAMKAPTVCNLTRIWDLGTGNVKIKVKKCVEIEKFFSLGLEKDTLLRLSKNSCRLI